MNKSGFFDKTLILLALCLAPIGCGDDVSNGDDNTGGTAGAGATGGTGGSGATGGSAGSGGNAGSGGDAGSGGIAGSSGAGGSGGGGAKIDCTTGVILAYEFGNQITGSELEVQSDGTVTHIERVCCPPAENDQNDPPLDAAKLAELKGWIEAAKNGTVSVSDGSPTSLGSSAGTLEVCSADGTAIIIHDITRNAEIGKPDTIQSNSAPEAQEIRTFVKDTVDDDMP